MLVVIESGATIVRVKDLLTVVPSVSLSVMETAELPATDGVPEIRPPPDDMDNPVGNPVPLHV